MFLLLVNRAPPRAAGSRMKQRCEPCLDRIRRNIGQSCTGAWSRPCTCDPTMAEPSFGHALTLERLSWEKAREQSKRLPDAPPHDDGEPDWS